MRLRAITLLPLGISYQSVNLNHIPSGEKKTLFIKSLILPFNSPFDYMYTGRQTQFSSLFAIELTSSGDNQITLG